MAPSPHPAPQPSKVWAPGPLGGPPRATLGPPPQLGSLKVPIVQQKFAKKVQPKLREVVTRHIKLLAKWFHTEFSWKQFLMSWMVILIASKMVLLALTFKYFTLSSLLSLQAFHGVWSLSFLCLTLSDSRSRLLPSASCLLAGYLPATTVLHILLIPNNFPLPYIITDAVSTLLAIVTMFALLRMECTQILREAEKIWEEHPQTDASESGTNSTSVSTGSPSPPVQRQVLSRVSQQTIASPQYQQHPSIEESRDRREITSNNRGYEEAIDLEPIDFEHFLEEPELERKPHLESMFRHQI